MRIFGTVIVVTTLALGLAGCVGGSEGTVREPATSDVARGPIEDPTWSPMATAVPATTTPGPLSGIPDKAEIDLARRQPHTRVGAEQFALQVAHLITDARSSLTGTEVVDSVTGDSTPEKVRDFLIDDIDGQHELGAQRRYDTDLEMWLRSQPAPGDPPSSVDVEIVSNLASEPMHFQSWVKSRLNLAWKDDQWRVLYYSGGGWAPDSAKNLTPAERRSVLTGPGWRRIPPDPGAD